MTESHIRNVIEAALLAAGKPLQAAELVDLFAEAAERPTLAGVQAALAALAEEYSNRGIEIKETAAGFRIQVRADFSNEISRLWPERPAKYSRALLETLAIIAYRQPITRAEIEAVRGVAVNPNIVKTVIERNWVHVVGHRDVPGRPELLATTRDFLDYFGLKRLDELPPLAEIKAIGEIKMQFDLPDPGPLALASDSDAAVEPVATAGEAANGEAATAEASAGGAANREAATAEATAGEAANREAVTAKATNGEAANREAADGEAAHVHVEASDAANADGNNSDPASGATAASSDADATSDDATSGEGAAQEHPHEGAVNPSEDDASAQVASIEGASAAPPASGEHTSGEAVDELTVETASARDSDAPRAAAGEASAEALAVADTLATDGEDSKKASPSVGRGSGQKKKRGKSNASDSALHEAEEFAASVDADLAAGDDDSSDEDELSAAGPDSSELVAGPRDIDD